MPQYAEFLECLAQALCEKSRKAFQGTAAFGESLPDVAKATLDHCHRAMTTQALRTALGGIAASKPEEYHAEVTSIVDGLARVQSVPFKAELLDYLSHFPGSIRSFLQRPSDPRGVSLPDAMNFFKPDELMMLLPPQRTSLRRGHEPAGLDDWKLDELLGLSATGETWLVHNGASPQQKAVMKFATDENCHAAILERQEVLKQVLDVGAVQGVVPLNTVFLETKPIALLSPYVAGYDLASLMWDWRWKYDAPKAEAALKLMQRLCEVVSKAQARGLLHGDLKPSNIRLHPTEGGKMTLWVTDYGWGQLAVGRELQLSKTHIPRGEQQWFALRGAQTPLYASPQRVKNEPLDPRDDVYSMGVIWYQLLYRDPHLAAPVGTEWAEDLAPYGVSDSMANLLQACLATRPDRRPANTKELGQYLAKVKVDPVTATGGTDGSRLISLKGHSTTNMEPLPAQPKSAPSTKIKGYGTLPKLIANTLGMTFVLIPPMRFLMGSPDEEPSRREHEGPLHEVTLTKPFYLAVHPVTQAQYEKVCGNNPAQYTKGHGGGPEHPVESITWDDAVHFCERLSALQDEQHAVRLYRLPTEAEWECACRAGTTTAYHCGAKLTPNDALFAAAGVFAKSGGQARTAPVGRMPSNPFGLYDMHGNVQEWVNDWYDEYYYHDLVEHDPPGPATGTMKVVRGGCYTMFASDCRSAARRGHPPQQKNSTIGFRVVLSLNG